MKKVLEMERASRFTLLPLLTLFALFMLFKLLNTALSVACTPIYIMYIVREGQNAIGMG